MVCHYNKLLPRFSRNIEIFFCVTLWIKYGFLRFCFYFYFTERHSFLGIWVRGLCGMTWSIYTVIGATVTVILGAVLLSIICTDSMPRKKTNVLSLFKTYAYLIKNSDSCRVVSKSTKSAKTKNLRFSSFVFFYG